MRTKEEMINKLMELGFSPSMCGFKAILELTETWSHGDKIMACYAEVAKTMNTSASSVERGIRHSIEVAMIYNPSGMKEFLKNSYDPFKAKPTITEFVSVLRLYYEGILS